MQEESRKFPRYEIHPKVKIAFNNYETISYVRGLNISGSGILCEIDQEIDMDEEVYFVISIPDENENKLEIPAQIVRVEEIGNVGKFLIAMVFLSMDAGNKRALHEYIDSIATGI